MSRFCLHILKAKRSAARFLSLLASIASMFWTSYTFAEIVYPIDYIIEAPKVVAVPESNSSLLSVQIEILVGANLELSLDPEGVGSFSGDQNLAVEKLTIEKIDTVRKMGKNQYPGFYRIHFLAKPGPVALSVIIEGRGEEMPLDFSVSIQAPQKPLLAEKPIPRETNRWLFTNLSLGSSYMTYNQKVSSPVNSDLNFENTGLFASHANIAWGHERKFWLMKIGLETGEVASGVVTINSGKFDLLDFEIERTAFFGESLRIAWQVGASYFDQPFLKRSDGSTSRILNVGVYSLFLGTSYQSAFMEGLKAKIQIMLPVYSNMSQLKSGSLSLETSLEYLIALTKKWSFGPSIHFRMQHLNLGQILDSPSGEKPEHEQDVTAYGLLGTVQYHF